MESREIREMSVDEVSIFLGLHEASNVDDMFEEFATTGGGWVLLAIEKRFAAHEINADKKVMIMVLCLGDGIVGRCANYVDDIVKRAKELNAKIDWNGFVNTIYPHGVPVF